MAQLWAEGLGMPCNALNLGCGITINSKPLTGTAKWDDMLKLCEIDKQNVLYLSPAAQCDAQTPEPCLTEYDDEK